MSKRNLITKLKNISKTVFNHQKDNHPSTEIQKNETTKGNQKVNHVYNQTKKELASKSELLRQYADKAKSLTENAKSQIHRGISNMINSANQLKKNISSEAESMIEKASKGKDSLINSMKSQQANKKIKENIQEKKGSLYQLGQKMKSKVQVEKQTLQKNTQRIIQSTNSYAKRIMEMAQSKIGAQKKESKTEANHYIEDSSNKNLVQASKQKPNKKEEKPEQNFYSHMKVWEKIKEAQQLALSKLIIKNAQSKISSMLTNIYWRLIFGACFIVFAFGISTQIPKEVRIYFTEKNKLQKEQQNFLKAQKQGDSQVQKTNL